MFESGQLVNVWVIGEEQPLRCAFFGVHHQCLIALGVLGDDGDTIRRIVLLPVSRIDNISCLKPREEWPTHYRSLSAFLEVRDA